jgi:hypothetical protein
MAKIPLTFACGLYDRMPSLSRSVNVGLLGALPPECHRSIGRIYLPNAALMAFAAFLSSCLIRCA